MLEVEGIHVYYGEIPALHGVSLRVGKGEIVTLLGSNGAGKTTTLKSISGLLRPHEGQIRFEGMRIDRLPPHRIVAAGVAHAPEGRRMFNRLTVLENLEMGAYARTDDSFAENLERVFTLFPRLKERRTQVAGTLSGGEQQMLAVARGIMARPRLMLLDEPSMGLAPLLVREIFHAIREIRRLGTAVLLVEQNVNMALAVANRAYVLQTGEIVLEGPPEDLRENAEVRAAYLGETPTGQRETE